MGGSNPPTLALVSVGGLASLFGTAKGYQGTVFWGIQGDLASLVSLGLDNLDEPVSMTGADDSGHGYCSLWLALAV